MYSILDSVVNMRSYYELGLTNNFIRTIQEPLPSLKLVLTICSIVLGFYITLLYFTNPTYTALEPPALRHYIPFLGHVVSFGQDQRGFFAWANKKAKGQPFTMYIAGEKLYVFSRADDVSQIMRMSKTLGITVADQKHFRENIVGFAAEDADKIATLRKEDIGVLNAHLLNTDSVTALTMKFLNAQGKILRDYGVGIEGEEKKVDAFNLVGELLLHGTVAAMLGNEAFDNYQKGGSTLFADYRKFLSEGFWARMIGLPAFFSYGAVAARERIKNRLQNLLGSPSCPDDVSDLIRDSIRVLHAEGGVSPHGTMSNIFDLTILGANLNSISMAYLTILHILSDPDLKTTIESELDAVRFSGLTSTERAKLLPEGTPRLRALLREVMRTHTTAWSAREVLSTTLLKSYDKENELERTYELKEGSIIAMPSSLLHHNPTIHASPSTFDAQRFLATSLGGKGTPTTSRELRPFGGGASYCPGRLFAEKQILGFVALILDRFEMKVPEGRDVEIPKNADFFYVTKQKGAEVLVAAKRRI